MSPSGATLAAAGLEACCRNAAGVAPTSAAALAEACGTEDRFRDSSSADQAASRDADSATALSDVPEPVADKDVALRNEVGFEAEAGFVDAELRVAAAAVPGDQGFAVDAAVAVPIDLGAEEPSAGCYPAGSGPRPGGRAPASSWQARTIRRILIASSSQLPRNCYGFAVTSC